MRFIQGLINKGHRQYSIIVSHVMQITDKSIMEQRISWLHSESSRFHLGPVKGYVYIVIQSRKIVNLTFMQLYMLHTPIFMDFLSTWHLILLFISSLSSRPLSTETVSHIFITEGYRFLTHSSSFAFSSAMSYILMTIYSFLHF